MLLDHVKSLMASPVVSVALAVSIGVSLVLLWGVAYRGRD